MKLIVKLVIYTLAVLITTYLLPGVFVDGVVSAIVLAAVLVVLKTVLKPILLILTFPITFLTLGLFILVINTVIILIADWMVPGFSVNGFITAFLFSLILSILVAIFEFVDGDKKKKR